MTTREGDVLPPGQYEVSNVVGSSDDSGSKAQFWSQHTGRDLSKQKCGILGCGSDAEVGGHVWVKGLSKCCFILPICQSHNKDPALDYKSTKVNARLVAVRSREVAEDCEYPVAVVQTRQKEQSRHLKVCHASGKCLGDPNREKFWSDITGLTISQQECGILGCKNRAEVGSHIWVEGDETFCYIMPMCKRHDEDENLNHPEYHLIKAEAEDNVVQYAKHKAP